MEWPQIPRIIATKRSKFAIENEVRLFLEAYPPKHDDDEYYIKHTNYVNRVFGRYNDKTENLDTYMPRFFEIAILFFAQNPPPLVTDCFSA